MRSRKAADNRPRRLRMRRRDRLGDVVFLWLVRRGLGPAWALTTRGRRTGRSRTVPVIPITDGDRRWLVSPYGDVAWVHNARAAGQVTISRGRLTHTCRVRELSATEAGPILQRYIRVAPATRSFFTAAVDAPVAAFVAEADRHPVFELIGVEEDRQGGAR